MSPVTFSIVCLIIRYVSSCAPCTIHSENIVYIRVCPASFPEGRPTVQENTVLNSRLILT